MAYWLGPVLVKLLMLFINLGMAVRLSSCPLRPSIDGP